MYACLTLGSINPVYQSWRVREDGSSTDSISVRVERGAFCILIAQFPAHDKVRRLYLRTAVYIMGISVRPDDWRAVGRWRPTLADAQNVSRASCLHARSPVATSPPHTKSPQIFKRVHSNELRSDLLVNGFFGDVQLRLLPTAKLISGPLNKNIICQMLRFSKWRLKMLVLVSSLHKANLIYFTPIKYSNS